MTPERQFRFSAIGLAVLLVIALLGSLYADWKIGRLEGSLTSMETSLDDAEAAVTQARLDITARDAEIGHLQNALYLSETDLERTNDLLDEMRSTIVEQDDELEWLRGQLATSPAPLTEPLPQYTPQEADPVESADVVPVGSDCNVTVTECWDSGEWICGNHDGVEPCTIAAQCGDHPHECWIHCTQPMECYGQPDGEG